MEITQRGKVNLIGTSELAELLDIHPATLRRLVESGKIPAVRVGRQWRFDRDVIFDLLHESARRELLDR
jgi:excisionase family DNA binding protein